MGRNGYACDGEEQVTAGANIGPGVFVICNHCGKRYVMTGQFPPSWGTCADCRRKAKPSW